MKLSNFFYFIHSLSQKEHAEFVSFMRGKKKSRTFLLYNRIKNAKDISEESLEQIKGAEFRKGSMFCIYRDKVTIAVLESIVFVKKPVFPNVCFVKEAYLRGADELGHEALFTELRKLEESEDFESLDVFHALIEDLECSHGIKIELPPSLLSTFEVRVQITRQRMLKSCIESTRTALSLPSEKVQNLLTSVKNIANRTYSSRTNQLLAARLNRNISFLDGKFEEAFFWGERVIELLKSSSGRFASTLLAKELRLLALNAAYLNRGEQAERYCFEVGSLNVTTEKERQEILQSLIKIRVVIALRLVDSELAKKCYSQLKKNREIFTNPNVLAKLYHTIGLSFFASAEYDRAIKCFNDVRELTPKTTKLFQWEPQLLLAISNFEANHGDYVEELLRSAQRAINQSSLTYPQLALKVIRQIISEPESKHKTVLRNGLDQIHFVLTNPDEEKASRTIQIENWIESKVRDISQKMVVLERNSRVAVPLVLDDFA